MQVKEIILSNGIKTLILDLKTFPSFTCLVLVKAGSRYESDSMRGIAHFFEHMVFKGSKKYPTSWDITYTLESLGAEANAFTSREYTGYYIQAQSSKFDKVVEVLSDAFFNPLLDKEEIEREKGVVIEEARMYDDIPQYRVLKNFFSIAFKNNLRYPIVGFIDTIKEFSREKIQEFLENYYTRENIYLVLAGDFSSIDLTSKLEEYFGCEVKKGRKNKPKDSETDFSPLKNELIEKKEVSQAHLVFGFKSPSRYSSDKYVFRIISAILGQGMASRLFLEIREKRGWAYYVSTSYDLFEDIGLFYVRSGVVNKRNIIQDTLKIIKNEFYSLLESVSESDLIRAKEYLKGRILLSLENNFDIAYSYGKHFLFYNEVLNIKEEFKKIDAVDEIKIRKTLRKYLDEKNFVLSVISSFDKFK